MADTKLVIKINGDVKGYEQSLKKVEDETESLQRLLNKVAASGAIVFASFGASLLIATQRFAEFDDGIRATRTLLDETSFSAKSVEDGFNEMSIGALRSLGKFPVTLDSLNKSLFDIVSAGIAADGAITALGSSSKLAVAGLTKVAFGTDLLTSGLNSFQISVQDADLVAAKFFTAQKFGKTTIEELSQFFGRAASAASAYNVSLDETLAATAAVTTGGIKTAAALNALPAVFSNIAKPTKEAVIEAERLGIAFNSQALRAQGLTKFLDTLTSANGFTQQSVERLFGSIEAQKIVFSLTGAQAAKYKQTLDALSDSQKVLTTFTEAYEVQSASLKNQTKILGNNLDVVAIMIGKNLAPAMSEMAKIATDFLQFLQDNPALVDLGTRVALTATAMGGLAVALGLGATAFLKIRAAIIASRIATNGLKLAVKGLIGSTGIGLVIAFLPEIIQVFQWAFNGALDIVKGFGVDLFALGKGISKIVTGIFAFSPKTIEKGIQQVKDALNGTTVEIEKLRQKSIADAKKEAEELEKANKQKAESSKNTNKQIVQDQKATSAEKIRTLQNENELIRATLKGREKEEIAFAKRRQEIKEKELAARVIQNEEEKRLTLENIKLLKAEIIKEEQDLAAKRIKEKQKELDEEKTKSEERVQLLVDENEIIEAKQLELTNAEQEFIRQRQELKRAEREAEKISNEEERNLALENLSLKHELLLSEEQEFYSKKAEALAEQNEIDQSLQDELNQLSAENRKQLQDAEIQELRAGLQTKAKIRSKEVQKELIERRKANKLFEKEEEEHGLIVAKFRALMRSKEFSNAQTAATQLAQLQKSKNAEMQAIGKAAALVQIAIDTQRGAIAAYTALAGIPVVGPGLGIAAAAALTAYGFERAANVQGLKEGGIVEGVGTGDIMPAMLEPKELVVPKRNFEETVNALVTQRVMMKDSATDVEEREAAPQEIVISLKDDAADIFTVQQNEESFLGISQRF